MNRSGKLTIAAAILCAGTYGAIAAKAKVAKVKVVTKKGKAVIVAPVAATAMPTPPELTQDAASATVPHATLAGVNISGGEFGDMPGRLYFSYTYPSTADIEYFAARGFKLIRIPFRWERLQPNLYGPLSEPDRAALKAAVTYATAKGLTVVLDMHDFAYRKASATAADGSIVGSAAVPATAFSNGWTLIANDYRDNPNVWLGLMNEPFSVGVADWWRTVQQVVTDLRAQHVTNKLMIPGTSWSAAYSWVSSGNAAQAEQLVDPANNLAFEIHQYLDADSSGTNAACVAGAANRVDAALAWATSRRVQLFVGEMGASGDPSCATEYAAMLAKLNDNAVIGWTAWGGGTWWNSAYPFKLSSPTGQEITPALDLLLRSMPS